MSSILFVTWDGGGNVPPALALARELAARGHAVRFLGHASQQDAITTAGFEFVRPTHARRFSGVDTHSPLEMMAVFGDAGLGRDLLAEVESRPADLVILDCLMFGALAAARDRGLRYAVLEHLYDAYLERGILRGPMGLNLRARRLRPRASLERAAVRLLTTAPTLDPAPGAANVRQVGPVVDVAQREAGEPLVVVSLSTYGYPGMTASFQALLEASTGHGARVLATTGPAIDPTALSVPEGVQLHAYVPHAELMRKATLFVGHGGHGSTMQALAHDLPVVLMPLYKLGDQPAVAHSVERVDAGATVPRRAAVEQLRDVIGRMLADGPHREAAARLGAEIRGLPGARLGADAVEQALGQTSTRSAGTRSPRSSTTTSSSWSQPAS